MSIEHVFYCGACKYYKESEELPGFGECICLEHNEPVPLAGGRYLVCGGILYSKYQCGCDGKHFEETTKMG